MPDNVQTSPSWFDLLFQADIGWGGALLQGALVTLLLALSALAVGLILGLLIAGLKLAKFSAVRWIGEGYTLIIRGTPEFLVLLMIYFSLSKWVNDIGAYFNLSVELEVPPFLAAVIGLAVIFGAYASEVFRGAYLSVPKGQMEAAYAYGLSPIRAFFGIRLPQMWRFAIPGLGNLWMVLLKDTSLAAVIALDELLRMAKIAAENTKEPLFFYLVAGLLYLLLTGISDLGRHHLERSARRGQAVK